MSRAKAGDLSNLNYKRTLRANLTPAENKLWLKLRLRQMQNLKFRRQHGIGPYIVDFYCPEKKLIIEIDGDIHILDEKIKKDAIRESYFQRLGLNLLRYRNNDVLKNFDQVLQDIFKRLDALPPLAPPYKGGET